jgi:hypothetical protein
MDAARLAINQGKARLGPVMENEVAQDEVAVEPNEGSERGGEGEAEKGGAHAVQLAGDQNLPVEPDAEVELTILFGPLGLE